jgi:hypothetical protein
MLHLLQCNIVWKSHFTTSLSPFPSSKSSLSKSKISRFSSISESSPSKSAPSGLPSATRSPRALASGILSSVDSTQIAVGMISELWQDYLDKNVSMTRLVNSPSTLPLYHFLFICWTRIEACFLLCRLVRHFLDIRHSLDIL